jgi:hypothetical protein
MRKLIVLLSITILILFIIGCNPKQITYNVEPEGAGAIEEVTHDNGIITVGAIPNEGYKFDHWSGGLEGYVNHCPKDSIEGNEVTAHFIEHSPTQIVDDDFETGDFSLNPYTLGGSADPAVQDSEVNGGSYAVQFGDINHDEESHFMLEDVTVNAETTVSFYVKVDCETSSYGFYDGFVFSVDGTTVIEWDNDDASDWTQYEHTLSAGVHTLKWAYTKDYIGDSGADTAWVDDLVLDGDITIEPPKPEIAVSGVENGDTVNRKVLADEAVDITYSIQNMGKAPLYVDNVIVDNPDFTISQQPASEVASGENTKFVLNVTVGEGQTKTTSVMIPNSDDDESPFMFDLTIEGVDAQPGWLFMMYMDGDNNLEEDLWGDINEMEYGLYQLQDNGVDISNIHFLILWDGTSGHVSYTPEGGKLYELAPDSVEDTELADGTIDLTSEKWWTGDEPNVGDGANVTGFLNWAEARYTGYMNRMIMFSNHGGGPGKDDDRPKTKAVCWDDDNGGDYLSTTELSGAIEAAGFGPGNKLSIVGFDVCLLGNIEEGYQLRNVSDYMVASPESEQIDGWEFNDWIPRMTSDMEETESLITHMVQSYRDNFGGDQTMTGANLTQMDNLKQAIDELASAIIADGKESEAQSIMSSVHSYSWGGVLHEFGEFCMDLETSSSMTTNIQNKAGIAGEALGEAIVYAWAGPSGGNYDGTGPDIDRGLSICATPTADEGYTNLDFATSVTANGWYELISSW